MEERRELERVSLLLGEENLEKLQKMTVMVAGVGGVGSYASEALARSGIGHLILIDKDEVDITNLNRQILATYGTVGVPKTDAMEQRIHSYNKYCKVEKIQSFLDAECLKRLKDCDFAIDAVDTVSAKLDFIQACHEANVPFISSLGMGNRLDPSAIRICELFDTEGDPLAKAVRTMARKRGIDFAVPVLFTDEVPHIQNRMVNDNGETRKDRIPPASMIFVPAEAGMLAASYAVRVLLGLTPQVKKKKKKK